MTSPIVINMPTGELLAGETKNSFVSRFQHLNNKSNVCNQIYPLFQKKEKEKIRSLQSLNFDF